MNIIHYPSKDCFSCVIDNEEAVLEYQLLDNNKINFSRTYVPNAARGKGVAEKLVRHGLAWAKEQQYAIQASCWYVEKFLR
ncbi:GNAT family N-acetyltransferase [Oceanicoccus sp. KOV_DT_Chl]|uniref:GNAT family N-acetyltransferase n=1 Tax=Oceanicoccus sp. KOV_DT_Chl TaxID=1904639 RepID=UPI000C7DFB71|nr:GNAT family N-acetyltransferase [Oceanicoccus sp. KOV_DT_Chl]